MKKSMLSFLVLGLSFLFSTDESVFLKQVELENIYKFKIESFLEKIYDKSEYYVFADVRLEKKPQPNSESSKPISSNEEEESSTDPFGYTFIEGLGLNPTLPTAPMGGNEKKPSSPKVPIFLPLPVLPNEWAASSITRNSVSIPKNLSVKNLSKRDLDMLHYLVH